MKISKIQRQKKDPQRYSIYINDQFAFGVDEQILIDFSLNKGKDLDQGLIDAILAAEAQQKLYLKGLNYLSYGLKSTKEMQDYLKEAGTKLFLANEKAEREKPSIKKASPSLFI